MRSSKTLNLINMFKADAHKIDAAYTASTNDYKAGNISESGRKIEEAIQYFFKSRLPLNYTTSQGHLVDEQCRTSSQIDLIIYNANHPTFARSDENTQYIPYNTVLAVGEIKRTLLSSHVQDFIGSFINFEKTAEDHEKNSPLQIKRVGKNRIYKFIFAVSSKGINIKTFSLKLAQIDPEKRPNMICIMDQGVFTYGCADMHTGQIKHTYIHPPISHNQSENLRDGIVFQTIEDKDSKGAILFIAYCHILEHLQKCQTGNVDFTSYSPPDIRLKYIFESC